MKERNGIEDMDEKSGLYTRMMGWGISGAIYILAMLVIYVIYINRGWTDSMYIPLGILLFSLIINIVINIIFLLIKE